MVNIPEETKEIELPSGSHKVLVRGYITGEDRRANRRLLVKLSEESKEDRVAIIEAAENALLSQIVLELDGNGDDLIDRILKLPADDYDLIIDTVNEVAEGFDAKKKRTLAGNTVSSSTGKEE